MPYLNQANKSAWDDDLKPLLTGLEYGTPKAGDLNYIFTMLALAFVRSKGLSYASLNETLGAFECAKLEFYRRAAGPYEDKKIVENGDVYP
jgi:hypothetical protein